MRRRMLLPRAAVLVASVANVAAIRADSTDDFGRCSFHVVAAFDDVPTQLTLCRFSHHGLELPRGGHLQGIQLRPIKDGATVILTRSSDTKAVFLTVDFSEADSASVIHVQRMPSDLGDPPLRHAGGFQVADRWIVVGVEDNQDKLRSEIQFWDVSRPNKPALARHLTIKRESETPKRMTAGAVGITRTGNRYFVAVSNWDARALDFYQSSMLPRDDPTCRFEPCNLLRWQASLSDRSDWKPDPKWGNYQSINLISDDAGQVFLVGFLTDQNNQNRADLYRIDRNTATAKRIKKLSTKVFATADGIRFQYGAGLTVTPNGSIVILATQYDLNGNSAIAVSHPDRLNQQ